MNTATSLSFSLVKLSARWYPEDVWSLHILLDGPDDNDGTFVLCTTTDKLSRQ